MGLFNKTPQEIEHSEKKRIKAEEREAKRLADEVRRREEEFGKSPAGQARRARAAGAKLFQLELPLSQTSGRVVAMTGAYVSTKSSEHASVLDSIEAEGWKLEHAGYVYRVKGSVSRDKFMSSGQQEAFHGEVIGIYIFRATEEKLN